MEIMLNGQLVSCSPKEYKELMDMGLIPGQPAGTSAAPVADWHEELRQIIEKYPKIAPEKPKFGSIAVTPMYGCAVPAEEAKKPVYAINLADSKPIAYLRKGAFDLLEEGTALNRAATPRVTTELCAALLFTSKDAASKFCDKWNDCKSHADSQVKFCEVEIPPNATLTFRGQGRVEISDFDMESLSLTGKVKQDSELKVEPTVTVYLLRFNDSDEPTYLSKEAYGKMFNGGGFIKTTFLYDALVFNDRERADKFAEDYNVRCVRPMLTVVSMELPASYVVETPD